MNKPTKNKAFELAIATKNVTQWISRFREAQHRVMYQLTNPSLCFTYEFKKSGEDMEECRIKLADAINRANDISWEVINEYHANKDNA